MAAYKLISGDSHIVEPPDMYTSRIASKYRDRAPRIERRKTPSGQDYDAWFIDGMQVGTLGAVIQAGQRFEDPAAIDFLGLWEDVRLAAYEPEPMLKELEDDGVWGACLQPSQGLFWYRIPDSGLLSAICTVYNDWIVEFCKADPVRLKAIGTLNIDDIDEGCAELERCAKLGMVGVFIPVYPLPDRPYGLDIYDKFWACAQDLNMPLLLHIATNRGGIPGCELTMNLGDLTPVGRSTTDHWVRSSLTAMIFFRRVRPLSRIENRLGRARARLDSTLVEPDGFHLPRAPDRDQRLALQSGHATQRLLAPQYVRRVYGRRNRHPIARVYRGG